jgi:hypothetical protein
MREEQGDTAMEQEKNPNEHGEGLNEQVSNDRVNTNFTRRNALTHMITAGGAAVGAMVLAGKAPALAAQTSEEDSWQPVGPSFNVLEFGACGDAKTDNTKAFQKVLDAAEKAHGGTFFAPSGKYLFKGNLVIPVSVTLKGIWNTGVPEHEFVFSPPDPLAHGYGTMLLPTAGRGQ